MKKVLRTPLKNKILEKNIAREDDQEISKKTRSVVQNVLNQKIENTQKKPQHSPQKNTAKVIQKAAEPMLEKNVRKPYIKTSENSDLKSTISSSKKVSRTLTQKSPPNDAKDKNLLNKKPIVSHKKESTNPIKVIQKDNLTKKKKPIQKIEKATKQEKDPSIKKDPLKQAFSQNHFQKMAKSKPDTNNPDTKKSAKEELLKSVRKNKDTPVLFKIKSRKHTPVVFTLDDVDEVLRNHTNQPKEEEKNPNKISNAQKKKEVVLKDLPSVSVEKRTLGAASLSDILGYNPRDSKSKIASAVDMDKIPSKFLPNYKLLVNLRGEINKGLEMHTQETLKRSSKEDSGDLSGYGQHMADAATDSFDRDFALSLVANEQEAIAEIEAAIKRILDGTYGICEITGESISKERLLAVPFTRYSLEGQKELEKTRRKSIQRGVLFAELMPEDVVSFTSEDAE